MSDKRTRDRSHLTAARSEPIRAQTPMEADRAMYGRELEYDTHDFDLGRRDAEPTSIFAIVPDRTQPRRAMPNDVRTRWDGETSTLPELFGTWMQLAAEERGAEYFSVDSLLEGAVEIDENGESVSESIAALASSNHPIEASLLHLTELAASIRQHGLINPITVVHRNGSYFLETGERRWLAHHLLHLHYPNDGWDKIPAQVVGHVDVMRQASENNVRNDLNAISKARQFAILLMELYRRSGTDFEPFDALVGQGDSDRSYYAQVADGEQFRIPRGAGETLLSAMGLKDAGRLRQIRNLLRLPDRAWIIADDYNLSENRIRQAITEASSDEELTELVFQLAQEGDDTVNALTVSGNDTVTAVTVSSSKPAKSAVTQQELAPGSKSYFSQLTRTLIKAGRGNEVAKDQARQMIDETRRWLDEWERRL